MSRQDRRPSLRSGQPEYLLGGKSHVPPADELSKRRLGPLSRPDDDLAIFFHEIHLGAGVDTVLAPQLLGDRHLSLACDSHGITPTVILIPPHHQVNDVGFP